jgi:protein disulfide isomerase
MKKFTFPGDVATATVDQIKKFITDFKTGQLVPFLKSEPIPAENDDPVKVIVGKSFNDVVLNPESDVLVKFYAPWCGHCKKLAPIWEQVAAELKEVKGLVIAKFDSTVNEVEGVEIKGYPTLKFYPRGSSKKTPIDFDGDRDAESIKTWLKEHSENYKKHLESKSEL